MSLPENAVTGLRRGTVRLEPHRREWERKAQETAEMLRRVWGGFAVDVQHIGSTAVRTICAKPILDMVIGVRDMQRVEAMAEQLTAHGIVFRGEVHDGQYLLVGIPDDPEIRTHHIHVVVWDGPEWNDYIDFRDFLNACPDVAAGYEKVKIRVARKFADSRAAYTGGKQPVIARLLRQARRWRRDTEAVSRLIRTPVGVFLARASHRHLLELRQIYEEHTAEGGGDNEILQRTEAWLVRYFAGEHVSPAELPLSADGTDFQRKVWQILQAIPYGETRTYGDIARMFPGKMSAQAVGNAVGANPIPVIIPCHRVLASSSIGGYRGGLKVKQQLLRLEKCDGQQ